MSVDLDGTAAVDPAGEASLWCPRDLPEVDLVASHVVKQGDSTPLEATLRIDSSVADLVGATITFRMSQREGAKIVTVPSAEHAEADSGRVEVPWLASDLDTPGLFDAEFEVDFPAEAETLVNGSVANIASASTITVDSTVDFASEGRVLMGGKAVDYTGKTATSFTGCSSPATGSVADNAVVTQGGGQRTFPADGYLVIDVRESLA